jgi:plastocyanin domain-containing protein
MAQSQLRLTTLLAALAFAGCNRGESSGSGQHGTPSAISNRIEIAVTGDGFTPSQARVHVGEPVTLVVTRKVERTCATDIVIKDFAINQPLPLGQPVTVTFTPSAPGPIRYACAMDMVAGELVAQ